MESTAEYHPANPGEFYELDSLRLDGVRGVRSAFRGILERNGLKKKWFRDRFDGNGVRVKYHEKTGFPVNLGSGGVGGTCIVAPLEYIDVTVMTMGDQASQERAKSVASGLRVLATTLQDTF